MMMTIIGMNLVGGEAKETIVMMNVVHVVVTDIKKRQDRNISPAIII